MEQIILQLQQAIGEINQGIALAKATESNPLDAYLDKQAMIADARAKVQKAISDLQAIQI